MRTACSDSCSASYRYAQHWHKCTHYAGGGAARKPWSKALQLAKRLKSSRSRSKVGLESGMRDSDLPLCPLARYLQRLEVSNASAGSCARDMRRARELIEASRNDLERGSLGFLELADLGSLAVEELIDLCEVCRDLVNFRV